MADNWIKAFHGPAKMKEGQFVPPEAYRLSTKPRPGYRKITMDRRVTLKTDSLSRCVGEKQVTMKEVFHTGSEIGNLPPGSRGIWFHICSAQDKDKSPHKTHVSKIQALLDGKGGNPKCRISYYSLNDVIGSYRRTLDISEVEFRIYGTTSSDMGFVYTVMVCPKACHEMDQKRFPVMKVGKCYDIIEIVKEESREDKYHLEWTPYSTDPNWMRDHLTFLFYVPVQEDEPLHYFRYQKMKSGKEREFPMDKLPAQQDLPAPKREPLSPQHSPPSPQRAPSVSYFDTPPPSPSSPTYKPSPVHYKLVDPLQPEAPSEYLSDFTRRKLRSHSDLDRLRLEKAVNSPNHYSNSLVQSDNDSSGASDSHKNSPALSDDDSSDASDSRNNSPAQSDNDSSDASDSHNNSPAQSDNDSSGTYDSCSNSSAQSDSDSSGTYYSCSNSPLKLEAQLSCKENVHDPEFDGIDKKGVRALAKQYFGMRLLTEASLNKKDYNHLDDHHDFMKRIQKEVVRNFASNGNDEDISAEGMADNWIKAFHCPAKMKEGQFVPPEAYRLSTKPRPGYRKITMDRRVTLKIDSLSQCVGEKQVTMKEVFHTGSEIGNLPPGSRGIWFHICSAQDKDKSPYKTHVSKIQALLDGKGGNPKRRISYYSLNDVIGSYRRTLDISEVEFRIYGTTSSDMGFVYTVMVCPKACHEMDQKRFPVMKVGKCYDVIEIVKEESREDKYHLEWTPYSTDPNWMRDHLTFLFYVPVQEDEPLHFFRYQKMKSGKEREFPMDKLPAQQDLPAPKREPLSPQYSPPSPQRAPSVSYFDTPPPSPSSPTYKPSPVHYKLVDPLQPEAPSEYLSDFTRRKLRSHSDLDRQRPEKAVNSPNHYSKSLVQSGSDSSGASDSRNNSPAQSDNDSSGTYDSCSNSPVTLEAQLSCKKNVHDPEFDGIDKKGVRALSRDLAKQYFGKKVLTEASLNRKDYNHLDDHHDYMKRIQKEVVRNFASNGNEEDIIRLCRKAISTYCSYLRSRTAAAYSDDESLDKFPAKPKARVSKSGCKSPKDQEYNINTTSVSAMSRDLAKHYFGEKVLAKSSLNRGDYNHLDDYDDMKRIQDMVVRKFASNGNDEDIIRLCRKSIATYCSNLRK